MKQQLIEKLKSVLESATKLNCDKLQFPIEDVRQIIQALTSVKSENNSEAMKEHAINFYFHCEDDEITDKKVQIIDILYRDYLTTLNNN